MQYVVLILPGISNLVDYCISGVYESYSGCSFFLAGNHYLHDDHVSGVYE
jgi:hypothetical protein